MPSREAGRFRDWIPLEEPRAKPVKLRLPPFSPFVPSLQTVTLTTNSSTPPYGPPTYDCESRPGAWEPLKQAAT